MTDREQEYLRLWILQDILLILKSDPEQSEAYYALVPDIKMALMQWAFIAPKEQL